MYNLCSERLYDASLFGGKVGDDALLYISACTSTRTGDTPSELVTHVSTSVTMEHESGVCSYADWRDWEV